MSPCSVADLGLPQMRPSHVPVTPWLIAFRLRTGTPLPLTYFRCGSSSFSPGSLCWPHTSKNQLALSSGIAEPLWSQSAAVLNRLFSLRHSLYPLPQPPCWSRLQARQPPNRQVFSRSVLSHLLKKSHRRTSCGVYKAKSNKLMFVTPEQLSKLQSSHGTLSLLLPCTEIF